MADESKQMSDTLVEVKGRLENVEDSLYLVRLLSDQLEALTEFVGSPVEFEVSRCRKSMVLQIRKQVLPLDR
jgi:hypothetical protein